MSNTKKLVEKGLILEAEQINTIEEAKEFFTRIGGNYFSTEHFVSTTENTGEKGVYINIARPGDEYSSPVKLKFELGAWILKNTSWSGGETYDVLPNERLLEQLIEVEEVKTDGN